jgi:predicted GNAT superfamily acetyltransferase
MTELGIFFRPLRTQDDYAKCVDLQQETWGAGFGECVPPSILLVTQKMGGVAAGAFDAEDRLLGFVFGLSGVRDGRPAHWSDMLAVTKDAQGHGLGIQLKAYQRELLLENGIEVAYWTYDPLEARNAHININRLGARPTEYVPDMYGESTSPVHSGLTTDRFVVEWQLDDPRVEDILAADASVDDALTMDAPVVNTEYDEGAPQPRELELPEADEVQVEVPWEIQSVKQASMDSARIWRATTQRAFLHYLGDGYEVTGFRRDLAVQRCFYVLTR